MTTRTPSLANARQSPLTRARSRSTRGWAVTVGAVIALAMTLGGMASATADAVLEPAIAVGESPYLVAFSPDGSTAYVSNSYGTGVSVINTADNTVASTIPMVTPRGVAFSPDGSFAYVASINNGTVTVIDTATHSVLGTPTTVGVGPEQVAFPPDGSVAYVANTDSGTVSIIDTATHLVSGSIAVGNVPAGLAFSPDGTKAYVTNVDDGTVTVIDTATRTVSVTIGVGVEPYGVTFSPDGSFAYVANYGSDSVSIIDTATDTVNSTLASVGANPLNVAFTPDGDKAYVTLSTDDAVAVIDTATHTLSGTILVGDEPRGLALSPNGRAAYVANNGDNTVTVITVDYAPEITSGPPLAAPVGSPFSHVVTADAFPAATFAVTAGALPTGLTLNAATGAISGTPTASGTFNFTVTATNTSGTDSQPHSLLITLGLAATGGDVTINPGSQSAPGATVWVPLNGVSMTPTTAEIVTAATTVELREGATVLASCVIPVGLTHCSDTLPTLTAGSHSVSYVFDNGTDTVTYTGTVFAVVNSAPVVTIEWQDAGGNWIDGSGIGVPLFSSGPTAGRCLVSNTSNAPASISSGQVSVVHGVPPDTIVPLTGTINPGEQRTFAFYSGPASGVQSVSCSLAVAFPASVGMNGGGNGGGIIHIAGTLTASPLSVTPGDTVTITGAGILPPLFEEIRVTFDGVEVPGSPTSLIPPDGGLDVDVVVPLVSNGPHIIEVQGTYDAGTRVIRVTLASFTATVSGGLATTGAADAGGLGFGAALLLVGGGVLFGTARARRRHASILGA